MWADQHVTWAIYGAHMGPIFAWTYPTQNCMPMLIPYGSHIGLNISYPEWHDHANRIWVPHGSNVWPICVSVGRFCVGTPICIPSGLSYQNPTKTNTHGPHINPMWGPYVLDLVGSEWARYLHPIWAFLPRTHQIQHTWAPHESNVGPICVRLGGFWVGTLSSSHLGHPTKNPPNTTHMGPTWI